jgi:alpha-glucosidase
LNSIIDSEQIDHGYDITNYQRIDPIFGTLEDFNKLLIRAHFLGIKVILDFVPNHTSDQHIWFENSVRKVPGFADFYVWHDGKPTLNKGRPLKPNNWVSLNMMFPSSE